MTRHDLEAWLDHHLDQSMLVEWHALYGGEVAETYATQGVLRKENAEYRVGGALVDLADFEAAEFENDGVVVELGRENLELYIALG